MKAQTRIIRISGIFTEAKRAKRWDADRECYIDPMGNIAIDSRTLDFDAMIQQIAEEEEYFQRKCNTPKTGLVIKPR
ncbi:hypothetical protein Hanom_Chr10g00930951 [Helianthus anomalus]